MSENEQTLQKGKWLDEYQAAQQRLAAIHGRVRDITRPVLGVANALQNGKLDTPGITNNLSEWPSREELYQLVADARIANQTLREVSDLLAQVGVHLK